MAAKPPSSRRGLAFGEKVRLWLQRNGEEGREPSGPTALAEALGETHPRILRALKSHDPKLGVAFKIARYMGESLDYLADPHQDVKDRALGSRWDSFVASLSPEDRDALAEMLSRSQDVRRLVIAYAQRDGAGRAARTSKPTGRQP